MSRGHICNLSKKMNHIPIGSCLGGIGGLIVDHFIYFIVLAGILFLSHLILSNVGATPRVRVRHVPHLPHVPQALGGPQMRPPVGIQLKCGTMRKKQTSMWKNQHHTVKNKPFNAGFTKTILYNFNFSIWGLQKKHLQKPTTTKTPEPHRNRNCNDSLSARLDNLSSNVSAPRPIVINIWLKLTNLPLDGIQNK